MRRCGDPTSAVERSFKRRFFIVDTGVPFASLKTLSNLSTAVGRLVRLQVVVQRF
jgi:hypothetical protein